MSIPTGLTAPLSVQTGVLPNSLCNFRIARALLIEDDRTMRAIVRAGLEDYCVLTEAPDVSQGITLYNNTEPDIVFLDIALPDGDGTDLLRWMLHNDPGAYIVMFSGHGHTNNVVRAMEIGARGFVSKPFDQKRMLYFIDRCPKIH